MGIYLRNFLLTHTGEYYCYVFETDPWKLHHVKYHGHREITMKANCMNQQILDVLKKTTVSIGKGVRRNIF